MPKLLGPYSTTAALKSPVRRSARIQVTPPPTAPTVLVQATIAGQQRKRRIEDAGTAGAAPTIITGSAPKKTRSTPIPMQVDSPSPAVSSSSAVRPSRSKKNAGATETPMQIDAVNETASSGGAAAAAAASSPSPLPLCDVTLGIPDSVQTELRTRFAPALAHLRSADPLLAALFERVGLCRLGYRTTNGVPDPPSTPFLSLLRAIVFQQLSTKAASTIYGRFCALFPEGKPTPSAVLAVSEEKLRSAGLSGQKASYVRDLSLRYSAGSLPLDTIHTFADSEIVEHLTAVKGIGKWSADMFMLFHLGRLDVLPEGDLGIQNAIMKLYRMSKRPTSKQVLEMGQKWRPYASVASWYLWRSLDNEPQPK
jgi:DNA-3-methyladenine glycosylase II